MRLHLFLFSMHCHFMAVHFCYMCSMKDAFMSEVSVVMQMYQSLSAEEMATFLRLLGLPQELTEIEFFLVVYNSLT